MRPATALLHLESELAPGADAAAFDAWCDGHHREVLAVPGFVRARRFEVLGGEPGPTRLLTLYDLDDAAVLESEAYAAHGRSHTPLPPALARSLSFARSVWSTVGPADAPVAGGAVVTEHAPAGAGLAAVPAPAIGDAVRGAVTLVGIRRFTSSDRAGSLTLVELRSPHDIEAALRALPAPTAGAQRSAYREVFRAVG